jgi:hypothetical protein
LPPQIDATELDSLLYVLPQHEQQRLCGWYCRDDNAVPPQYVLQPRVGPFKDGTEWGTEERELRALLGSAITTVGWEPTDARRLKYEASATHQEILHGALQVADATNHIFGFFRTIEGLPLDATARDYLDLDLQGKLDQEAHKQLDRLQAAMRIKLPNTIHTYSATWTGCGPSTDHLQQLCMDVYLRLSTLIDEEVQRWHRGDPVAQETMAHTTFGFERAQHFIGRENTLERIREYLQADDPHPLVLQGASGVGKSALMAKAAQQWEELADTDQKSELVVRYIGASSASLDLRMLLEGLCKEITLRYGGDTTTVPADLRKLEQDFHARLALATAEKPLTVFLDALDQLGLTNDAHPIGWLPRVLPLHVRLVVSVLENSYEKTDALGKRIDGCSAVLRGSLPAENLICVERLTADCGAQLLDAWLAEAGRTLQPAQRREVLQQFAANGLPLYLKLAFEESRRWTSWTAPVCPPVHLSPDIHGILGDLFARLEQPQHHGALLVSRVLAYLATGRHGLAEDELLDLLSADAQVMADFIQHSPTERAKHPSQQLKALPILVWSRLRADLEPYLAERLVDGTTTLTFYHRQVGESVRERYLKGDKKKRIAAHRRVARYFKRQTVPTLRQVMELPFQQHQALAVSALVNTLCRKEFIDFTARELSPEVGFDNIELGFDLVRRFSALDRGVRLLLAWGYLANTEHSSVVAKCRRMVNLGRIRDALWLAGSSGKASTVLTVLAHEALDQGRLAEADELLAGLLRGGVSSSQGSLRALLTLVDRFIARGHWYALGCLHADDAEETAVRVLCFLMGTSHFSEQLVRGLLGLIDSINEPYWRGVVLVVLCCRTIRENLPIATTVATSLRQTLRGASSGSEPIELCEIAARHFRWLACAGLNADDIASALQIESIASTHFRTTVRASRDYTQSRPAARFAFLREGDESGGAPEVHDFQRTVQRALGAMLDHATDPRAAWNPRGISRLQQILVRSVQSNTREGIFLFWHSLLLASRLQLSNSNGIDPAPKVSLEKISPHDRGEVLLSLRRMGMQQEVHRLLAHLEHAAVDNEARRQFCTTVRAMGDAPEAKVALDSFAGALRRCPMDLGIEIITELLRAFRGHAFSADTVYWIRRLSNEVAPKTHFPRTFQRSPNSIRGYILLNAVLPPIHLPLQAATVIDQAEKVARQPGYISTQVLRELRLEFGLHDPPLGHLADRIAAIWCDESAWHTNEAAESLRFLSEALTLQRIHDDRERVRSCFFWLLVLSNDPAPDHLRAWANGLSSARAVPLRYESAILKVLNTGAAKLSHLCMPKALQAGKMFSFRQLTQGFTKKAVAECPSIFGEWADAALRAFDDPIEQAEAMAFLAEAAARSGKPGLASIYQETAKALAPDLADHVDTRVAVGEFASRGSPAELRTWPTPSTFSEAFHAALENNSNSASPAALLALTEFLRRSPDQWGELLVALSRSCSRHACLPRTTTALLDSIVEYHYGHEDGSPCHERMNWSIC